MADDQYTFTQARARLEEIVTQVRRKDVSLEKSLDLLEEGVRLANACTEAIDHTEWRSVIAEQEAEATEGIVAADDTSVAELAEQPVEVADSAIVADGSVEAAAADIAGDFEVIEVTEVAVVEIDEAGNAVVEVSDFVTFAEADDAWPDDDAAQANHGDGEISAP